MKTIGNKIKELRRSKGMSQKDIADKLGVTSQAVSKWENDGSLPEMTMLPDIASLLTVLSSFAGYANRSPHASYAYIEASHTLKPRPMERS